MTGNEPNGAALLDELSQLAASTAVTAGDRALAARQADVDSTGSAADGRTAMEAAAKSSRTDVVTRHDRAAEETIVSALATARPDDAIVGEEGTDRSGTSGVAWHIDPIDGTTNFLYGLPMWSTSIAAADADGTLVGVVYLPVTGELFSAVRGGGARRNGLPIAASGEDDLALALVATGFGYTPERRRRQAELLQRLAGHVRDVRRMGSAAIDLVYTAAGFLDAYYEEHLNSWDMAAGELIAREAGCRTGDFAGGPPTPEQLLVAPPGLHPQLQRLLARFQA